MKKTKAAPQNFEKPEHLSRAGSKAYKIIMDYLESKDMADSGGCKVFYAPKEWTDRRETYGKGSVLIVVYDGGLHRHAFTLDETTVFYTALTAKLEKAGLRMEPCTCWYAAIYAD